MLLERDCLASRLARANGTSEADRYYSFPITPVVKSHLKPSLFLFPVNYRLGSKAQETGKIAHTVPGLLPLASSLW